MLTAVIWSKIEIETGSRIPIWRTFVRIQWHVMPDEPRATLQGERIPSAILKIVFRRIFCFINAVWALASGGFRIVFDTLIEFGDFGLCNFERTLLFQAAFEFQPFNSLECKGNYSATSNNMKLVHWPLMRGQCYTNLNSQEGTGQGHLLAVPNVIIQPPRLVYRVLYYSTK